MNLSKLVFTVCAASTAFFFTNCASNTNFYSARPLGKGNIQAFATVSNIQTLQEKDTVTTAFLRPDFTIFELGAAVGITDKFDVGIKYSFPTAGFVEARYNLVSTGEGKGFYFTPGLRAGYTSFTETDSTESNGRVELAVPLFVSIYPLEWLGITLIPTYSLRYFTANDDIENLLGGNFNLRFGKKFGFVVEAAYHRNFAWEWSEFQVGGGIFLEFRDLF